MLAILVLSWYNSGNYTYTKLPKELEYIFLNCRTLKILSSAPIFFSTCDASHRVADQEYNKGPIILELLLVFL